MNIKTWQILITILFFQNFFTQNNQGQYYLIEDLQIKSPLQGGKRFLGWYVDGEWEVEQKNLTFLNFKEKSFVLTNNLLFKSESLQFKLDFNVDYDKSKFVDKVPLMNNPEVFQISLFPGLYPITDFMPYSSKLYLWGYSLVFLTKKQQGYVIFAENMNLKRYDFQTFYQSKLPKNKKLFCKHNYRNQRTQMNINFSFKEKKMNVLINDKPCISININTNIFNDQKATLTMNGYSSGLHPIKIQIKEISIYKYSYDHKQFDIMKDVSTFHQAMHANLPGSFAEKSSLANLRLIQGKIDKEINNITNQTELLAKRTEAIEKLIKMSLKNNNRLKNQKIN